MAFILLASKLDVFSKGLKAVVYGVLSLGFKELKDTALCKPGNL